MRNESGKSRALLTAQTGPGVSQAQGEPAFIAPLQWEALKDLKIIILSMKPKAYHLMHKGVNLLLKPAI